MVEEPDLAKGIDMVQTDRLLYIDLHKTGCSHIRRMLQIVVEGQLVGKHNRPALMPADRLIVGSVRNPWDWYVSLWAFGCARQGAVYNRTTRRFTPWYYSGGLMATMYQRRWRVGPILRTVYSDLRKPVSTWRDLYSDVLDPGLFRVWLRLLLSAPRRFDLGEGFGFSNMSRYAGLMSYRYIKLFSRDISALFSPSFPRTPEELREFDAGQNALDTTIRAENLEDDLLSALERAGYHLSLEKVEQIRTAYLWKTNRSTHKRSSYYYDRETSELVRERELLIVGKYGYTQPRDSAPRLPGDSPMHTIRNSAHDQHPGSPTP